MTDLVAVAYVSSAAHPFFEDELERLLVGARQANESEGITGVLLYDDGTFFQYIEGPAEGIDRIYKRIKASHEHHGLIQLFNRKVHERNFQDWSMGFTKAPKSMLLSLSQASWEEMVSTHKGKLNVGSGIKLLLEFWSKAVRR
ncbi:sensor of blue-light using FAD [Burkholderiales bacterium JOSHI_001]|nr:sensor of blue-light using FAD [Burkholderiales bacterium JOSHI_001]